MLVKKYCVFFTFDEQKTLFLLDDGKLPFLELNENYNLYNYNNFIKNIYFSNDEYCSIEHSDIYQDDKGLNIVDYCILYFKQPTKGEWHQFADINEMVLNGKLDKKEAQYIVDASKKA